MGTGITILLVFIAVVVTLLIAVPVTRKIAVDNKIKQDAEKIGTAEEKARNIIDEALKTAETKKREALLEAKEESLRTKNEVEKETRERRAELQKYEKRVLSKEESVDKKADVLERRENEIAAKEASVRKKEKEVDGLHEKGVQELERISGFTSEEAKEYLLKSVEDEVKIDTAKLYKELESRAKEEAAQTVAENAAAEDLADASDNGEADQTESAPQEPENEEVAAVPESTATPVPTATPAPTPTPADYPASEITASLVSESSVDFSSLHVAYLKSAYATSEIKQASGVSNDPVLIFDGDTNTNWEEGVDGPGIGESITGEFEYEKEKVRCIALKLGNWKSEKYYYGNNRPSKLTITLDDLSFQMDFPDSWEEFYVMLNHPYKASSIRLTIDGVHAGSSWDDTCITDVRVLVE